MHHYMTLLLDISPCKQSVNGVISNNSKKKKKIALEIRLRLSKCDWVTTAFIRTRILTFDSYIHLYAKTNLAYIDCSKMAIIEASITLKCTVL